MNVCIFHVFLLINFDDVFFNCSHLHSCTGYSVVLQVFWHLDENPKMKDVKFQRGDVVEFEVYRDDSRGEKSQSRARNMLLVRLQSSGDSKEQCGKPGKPKNKPCNLGMSLYCQRECILLFWILCSQEIAGMAVPGSLSTLRRLRRGSRNCGSSQNTWAPASCWRSKNGLTTGAPGLHLIGLAKVAAWLQFLFSWSHGWGGILGHWDHWPPILAEVDITTLAATRFARLATPKDLLGKNGQKKRSDLLANIHCPASIEVPDFPVAPWMVLFVKPRPRSC